MIYGKIRTTTQEESDAFQEEMFNRGIGWLFTGKTKLSFLPFGIWAHGDFLLYIDDLTHYQSINAPELYLTDLQDYQI